MPVDEHAGPKQGSKRSQHGKDLRRREAAQLNLLRQLDSRILAEMDAQQVSQVEMARRTKLTPKHVNQVLRGHSHSLKARVQLLDALGYAASVTFDPVQKQP